MNRTQADIQTIVEKKQLFAPLQGSAVLITGATGLIGSMLAKTLLAADETYGLKLKVFGQIRNPEKANAVYAGLTDRMEFVPHDDVPCDFIIHTVSPTSSRFFIENPVETIKSSVGSAMSILEVARKNNASLVYLSSMEQYGTPCREGQIMTEEQVGIIDPLNIRSSYSESKRLCECLCASYASEYGVNVKIARLAQTFGAGIPLTDHRMPMQFAGAVVEEKDIVLHTRGNSMVNFVYLTDALTGILTILEKGKAGQAYNICNDRETRSVREIAELVAKDVAAARIGVRVEIPAENMGYAPDVKMYLHSGKLRSLGWNPEVDMAEAYRNLAAYLRESRQGI